MSKIVDCLDEIEQTVMHELKDFQRATVERIDYLYRRNQNRILVSDEVGLGKTLVARGAIAKFAKLRREEGDNLVKVLYICSNATIAEQNLDKLRIINEIRPESTHTSRLSMQHLNIFKQENDAYVLNKYIQLIPLTPQTSFKVSNSQGTMDERALMFAIMKRIPDFERYRKSLQRIFRFGVNKNSWKNSMYWFENQVTECDEQSDGKYIEYMVEQIVEKLKSIDLWEPFGKLVRKKSFDKKEVKPYIVKLRFLFADISLNKLDPDLIIMDEFQRFKYLLSTDENSEMDRLTNKFFNSEDVRILMLSATPYKMYSTLDEIDEEQIDAHYSEFFDVIDFLNKTDEEKQKFREIWSDYSIKLKEFNHDKVSFISAKANAENAMYKNFCRTERITENQLGDMVDGSDSKNQLNVLREDINSFMEIQQLLDDTLVNVNVPMDYVKSTPYLMSFMKNYQLKRKIERYFESHPNEFNKLEKPTLWLNENEINEYKKISPNNARLDNLMTHVLNDNAANLLWVPPSRPYYDLEGAFKDCKNFSKTLIFSSWEMVPRMISSLVSYEIERQTMGRLPREGNYSNRKNLSSRMNFSLKRDKPKNMTLFALIYPSKFLIEVYNPLDCLNRGLSLKQIEEEVKIKIHERLKEIPWENTLYDDFRWYYLAPMLLDSSSYVDLWFSQSDRLVDSEYSHQKGFLTHYNELKETYYNFEDKLDKKPDDLERVLCDMAIASPAICAYRAYEKEMSLNSNIYEFLYAPTQIARKFIDRMNLPESISVIDLNFGENSGDAYWKNVLAYSKQGNLQAVFDEYVHLLSNGLDRNNDDRILIINNKFINSFEFRTTSYDIDTLENFKLRMHGEEYENLYLRTHFAASFTKGRESEKDTNRKKSVRDAFNAPFRPFVLASTSIGQEGLDFHNYCRRIVHWNLPSNPIDLEQREGRINRFECLAIRQNLAKRYSNLEFVSDVWEELFIKASEMEKGKGCSDLIPYWGLTDNQDMIKIERIVPVYPFSRDEIKYDRLIRILSLYRLTLGQARQEELLEAISSKLKISEEEIGDLFINLSPFYREDFEWEEEAEDIESEIKPQGEFPFSGILLQLTTSDEDKVSNFSRNQSIECNDYWSKLKGQFKKQVFKWSDQCYWIPISDFQLDLARIEMLINDGYLEVKLYHPAIKPGKALFDYLFDLKDEIEEELGFELLWNKKPKKSFWKVAIFVPIDIDDNEDDAISWHLFMAKRFDEVFSDRIRQYFSQHPVKYYKDLKTGYWRNLTNELSKTGLSSNVVPAPNTWYSILLDDVPFSECRIELHAYTNKRQIKTSVIIERSRKDLYQYLLNDKLAIEDELGFELEWHKNKGRRHIRKTHEIDIREEGKWKEAIEWHLNCAQKLKNIFNPRIIRFYENMV